MLWIINLIYKVVFIDIGLSKDKKLVFFKIFYIWCCRWDFMNEFVNVWKLDYVFYYFI